jgi:hypothetical protein
MMMNLTPAELADELDRLRRFRHVTAPLSMLDQATLAYGARYPHISGPQRAFSSARHAHMRSYSTATGNYSDEAWDAAMDSARALATALRAEGVTMIDRCKRPTGWGTCDFPLDYDGTCHSTDHAEGGHS